MYEQNRYKRIHTWTYSEASHSKHYVTILLQKSTCRQTNSFFPTNHCHVNLQRYIRQGINHHIASGRLLWSMWSTCIMIYVKQSETQKDHDESEKHTHIYDLQYTYIIHQRRAKGSWKSISRKVMLTSILPSVAPSVSPVGMMNTMLPWRLLPTYNSPKRMD